MFRIQTVRDLPGGAVIAAREGISAINRAVSIEIGREPIMIIGSASPRSMTTLFVNAPPREYTEVLRGLWGELMARSEATGAKREGLTVLVMGGSDKARWKASKMVSVAQKGGAGSVLTHSLDGACYRSIRIEPSTGEIALKETEVVAAHTNPGSASLTLDDDLSGFGASSGGDVVANATRFFRHEKTFDSLRELVIPHFLETQPAVPFTLWSAACSNGTEAYSYAMSLHHLFATLHEPARFKILATDFNQSLVSFAQEGVYEPTKKDLDTYRDYFSRYGKIDGKQVTFSEEIKRHITFKQYDLRKVPPAGKFSYIVAANVFQYYQPEARVTLLKNLRHALRPGGYIFANPYTPTMARACGLEPISHYQLYHLPGSNV